VWLSCICSAKCVAFFSLASAADLDHVCGTLSDAEEYYGAIVNSIRELPGLPESSSSPESESSASRKFVEQYMMGQMQRECVPSHAAGVAYGQYEVLIRLILDSNCDEAPEEPSSVSTENVLKIECNISITPQ
jgi:ubiquitin carboxyl-terminal hydrolase 14